MSNRKQVRDVVWFNVRNQAWDDVAEQVQPLGSRLDRSDEMIPRVCAQAWNQAWEEVSDKMWEDVAK